MHIHKDWLTNRQTDWHKKERKSKTPTMLSMLVFPRYWVSVLYTRCGGCHLKELIVAS